MIAVKDGGPSGRIHEVKSIVCAFIFYLHSKSASQPRFDSLLFCDDAGDILMLHRSLEETS